MSQPVERTRRIRRWLNQPLKAILKIVTGVWKDLYRRICKNPDAKKVDSNDANTEVANSRVAGSDFINSLIISSKSTDATTTGDLVIRSKTSSKKLSEYASSIDDPLQGTALAIVQSGEAIERGMASFGGSVESGMTSLLGNLLQVA